MKIQAIEPHKSSQGKTRVVAYVILGLIPCKRKIEGEIRVSRDQKACSLVKKYRLA